MLYSREIHAQLKIQIGGRLIVVDCWSAGKDTWFSRVNGPLALTSSHASFAQGIARELSECMDAQLVLLQSVTSPIAGESEDRMACYLSILQAHEPILGLLFHGRLWVGTASPYRVMVQRFQQLALSAA